VVHGATVEEDSLIGIGAIMLNGAVVGKGSVAGCETYTEVEQFADERSDWFGKFLPLENGIPSHDTTIGRVLAASTFTKTAAGFAKAAARKSWPA